MAMVAELQVRPIACYIDVTLPLTTLSTTTCSATIAAFILIFVYLLRLISTKIELMFLKSYPQKDIYWVYFFS